MIKIPITVSYYPTFKSGYVNDINNPIYWKDLDFLPKSCSFSEKEDANDTDIVVVTIDFRLKSCPDQFKEDLKNGILIRITRADGSVIIAGQRDYWLRGSVNHLTPSSATGKSGYAVSMSCRQNGPCLYF